MFLPILIAQMVMEKSSRQMSGYQKTITEEIDVTTGQNFYTFAKKVNRFTMQFRDLIRTANALVADLAWTDRALKSLSLFYDRLKSEDVKYWCAILNTEEPNSARRGELQNIEKELKDIVEYQQNTTDNLRLAAENIRERSAAELGVVCRDMKPFGGGRQLIDRRSIALSHKEIARS
jgi:hypothetical protein